MIESKIAENFLNENQLNLVYFVKIVFSKMYSGNFKERLKLNYIISKWPIQFLLSHIQSADEILKPSKGTTRQFNNLATLVR